MIIDMMAREIGIPVAEVQRLADTASVRYKTYTIKKRNGGDRTISQPTPRIKFLQRWLIARIFSSVPVHSAATAYIVGKGIRDNAAAHVNSRYLLKKDFINFFPSITDIDIYSALRENRGLIPIDLEEKDYLDIGNICCRYGALSIGAPSSPILSNIVMYKFDKYVTDNVSEIGAKYTRYADDISISTHDHEALNKIDDMLKAAAIAESGLNLVFNERKTVFCSKKNNRSVTGLVITPQGKISLGRDRKRYIKSLVHQASLGTLDQKSLKKLSGWISFANGVEPDFILILKRKYSEELILRILVTE